jgi:hypothetical protein
MRLNIMSTTGATNITAFSVVDEEGWKVEGVADAEVRAVERKERLKRLKAGGWKRERFCPERYQEIARRAMTEL